MYKIEDEEVIVLHHYTTGTRIKSQTKRKKMIKVFVRGNKIASYFVVIFIEEGTEDLPKSNTSFRGTAEEELNSI